MRKALLIGGAGLMVATSGLPAFAAPKMTARTVTNGFVRANSRRHPQPQAAVIQNKQLTTAAMQKQLQTPSPQQCILQQGQCTGITHPERLRWNRVRCSCQHRCGIDATEQRCTKHQHASIHHRIGPVFLRLSEPKER